jgi:hypothetical protein
MAKKSTDPCRAERANVARSEAKVAEMEERLPEVPARERRRLEEEIRAEKLRLRGFRRQLTICENAH